MIARNTMSLALGLVMTTGLHPALAQQGPPQGAAAQFDSAVVNWDKGRYIPALETFAKLLSGPSAATFRDSIALITGELYRTTELTAKGPASGMAPAISADGQFAAFQILATPATTRLVRVSSPATAIAEFPATAVSFSPSGNYAVYLRDGAVTLRSLPGGTEQRLTTEWRVAAVEFGKNDNTLFLVAGHADSTTRNDIVRATRPAGGAWAFQSVTSAPGFKTNPEVLTGNRYLLYTVAGNSPIPAVVAAAPAGGAAGGRGAAGGGRAAGGGGGRGGGGGGGRGGGGAGAATAVVDLTTGAERRIAAQVVPSSDGTTLLYTTRSGDTTLFVTEPVAGGAPTTAYRTVNRVMAPALSPDGKRIAFQMMTKEDWEIYMVSSSGSDTTRVTREIQHDLRPVFLNANRIFATQGEGRHTRSYIYDLTTLTRRRLFHNNTVRTIAPEYAWTVSADASKIAFIAERDGDTVSPERGVYVMDLNRPVTNIDVLTRVQANLASEIALRAKGITAYAPIASQVRAVTEQVSTTRIYSYEKTLFDFDSKHISRPGNRKAIEYLTKTYGSFGYAPQQQWFRPNSNTLGDSTANVLAVLRGTENPEIVYVVSSHFDSQPLSPGADDNTSGTAALLEAARVLRNTPMPTTIVFASFTGEEAGLLGSREWVRRAVADKMQLVGALNNDMLGWANDNRLDNTIRYSNPGIRDIQHAAAMQFSELITYDALYYKNTDAAAYYDAYGDIVGGIGSYPVLGNPHYHQAHDMLEYENHQLIAEVSKTTVATLMLLASSPSRLKDLAVANYAGRAATITWTPSPEKGVTSYIVTHGPASNPTQNRVTVTGPRAQLTNIAPGTVVQVKAVNSRGLEGWDWARVTVGQ